MTFKNTNKVLMKVLIAALLMGSCSYFQRGKGTPEGTWVCTSEWSNEREGVIVHSSSEQQCTCIDSVMSVTGVITIGDAQWTENKEGTCYASGDELYGTWTSVQTVPQNDAARQLEAEELGGDSLETLSEQEYRVQVTSRTDTQLEALNEQDRVISCTRL
jgi:hypothetical protein